MRARLLAEASSLDIGSYRLLGYDQLPDEARGELVCLWLYVTPSPFAPHQVISDVLEAHFDRIASGAGGFRFPAPLDLGLAHHSVVQPDVMYLSATRLEILGTRGAGPPRLVGLEPPPTTAPRDP